MFFDEESCEVRVCLDTFDDVRENILTNVLPSHERTSESPIFYEINRILDTMIKDFAYVRNCRLMKN